MNVKLISITKPLIDEAKTAEELLVYIARVSNPSNQANSETADRLINYMIKNKHWSPFDMVNLCVEVKTSRAIAQQILRHWSIRPQEFSQRYAEVVETEPVQIRRQGVTNRQSSEEEFDPIINYIRGEGHDENEDVMLQGKASLLIDQHILNTKALYKALLDRGVAKECARMVLPLTTQTTMYLNGSVRSWIHYLEQRTDSHAQLEHRQVANEIKSIFIDQFPIIAKALQLV